MAEWPLTGRAAELERMDDLLRGGSGGVVLAGPPGVGKTRLGAEGLALAASRGFATLRVAGTHAAAGLPFGAFAALLPELPPGAERTQVLRRVAGAIAARGEGRPVALLVDDAHLLDEASAALTHQLAHGAAAFVLATVRAAEPASDAVVALWKDELAERMELRPFSQGEVEALLAAALGGGVDGGAVRLLWERTEGNALFLRELVLAALEGGALCEEGGLWRLRGPLPASARLVEVVEARLRGFDVAERALLGLVALGEPLGIELVARMADGTGIEGLERRGVLRVEEEGRRLTVRLAHPLYSEVLRSRLSPLRVRALSGALADALEGVGARRREDLLRLATWRLAGGGERDPALMLAGARQAHARHDFALAERLARAAWDGGAGFEAGLLLAIVISHRGRSDEAEALLARLRPEAALDVQRAALAVSRCQNFLFLRRVGEAIAAAEEAEAGIVDLGARAEVGAQRAMLLLFSGRVAEARLVALSLVPHAAGAALVLLALVGAYTLATAGRLAEACRLNALALETHLTLQGAPLLWPPGVHRFVRLDALSLAGELAEAEALAAEWYARALDEAAPLEQAYVTSGLAKTLTRQGRMASAVRWARLSERLFREVARPSERGYSLVYLAHALALSGSHEEAAAALAHYDALPGAGGEEFGPEVLQARGWVRVAAGDLRGGTGILAEAARIAREHGSLATESLFLHDLARLGRAAEVAPRLAELARVVEGPLAPVRAGHAAALAAAEPGPLEAVADAFAETGALLLAAEAAADAAVAWRRRGDPRRATAAERRARPLAARCEGARTPALATAPGARVALTARELEIARLAAGGASNKEIAARLYLSVRTVENKLSAAYKKLGVERRAELGAALEPS